MGDSNWTFGRIAFSIFFMCWIEFTTTFCLSFLFQIWILFFFDIWKEEIVFEWIKVRYHSLRSGKKKVEIKTNLPKKNSHNLCFEKNPDQHSIIVRTVVSTHCHITPLSRGRVEIESFCVWRVCEYMSCFVIIVVRVRRSEEDSHEGCEARKGKRWK